MTPIAELRAWLDRTPATLEQLDQIDTITVDQQIDMAWEARIEIPIRTKQDGSWSGTDPTFAMAFARMRVEMSIAGGTFVPIIDGPVVGAQTSMSSQPGQSVQTIVVQDDSVYLNRQAEIRRLDNMADHEVATQLFADAPHISESSVEETRQPTGSRPRSTVLRGPAIGLLRELAAPYDMHAYVVPGDEPDQSVGRFETLTTARDGLPDLVLLGDSRNVAEFHVTGDWQRPSTVTTNALDIGSQSVTEATSTFADLGMLGDAPVVTEQQAASRLTQPGRDDAVNPQQHVQGAAGRDSFAFSATGTVTADAYYGVLTPYRVVQVRALDEPLNGDYTITQVTHRVTRSEYTQSFSVTRNAVAGRDDRTAQGPAVVY